MAGKSMRPCFIKSFLKSFLFFFFLLLIPSLSWARRTSATANNFLPAVDDSPYLTVYGSQTFEPWRYQVGASFNYTKNPLEVGLGGARRTGIIDHLLFADIFGALGVTEWLQLGLNVPVALYEKIDNGNLLAGTVSGAMETVTTLGDVRFETKFRLLDVDRHHFGVAVMPYLLSPTGAGSNLVGNNSFAGGAKVIGDVNIKDRVQMSLNLGYLMRDNVTVLNTRQDDQFTYGLGLNVRALRWLHIISEAYGATNVGNFFGRQAEAPLEVDAGFRFFPSRPHGLAITVGGGIGLTFGYGAPDYRALVSIGYPSSKSVEPPPPAPVARVEKEKIVITKKIHFEFDRAVVRPISFPILDAVVDLMKQKSVLHKVRIEGHTDSRASDKYNMKLSQRRTDAVREYLIAHGISGDRLVAVGYGESRPIDTNESPEGRARNRRVEFTILE